MKNYRDPRPHAVSEEAGGSSLLGRVSVGRRVRPLAGQRVASQVNVEASPASPSLLSGGTALGAYPAGPVGGVGATGASCAFGARPSIALRTAARAPAPRRRVTAEVGEARRSGRDARLPEAGAGLAARQETARATQTRAGPPPKCASTCGPGLPARGRRALRRQEAVLQPPPYGVD